MNLARCQQPAWSASWSWLRGRHVRFGYALVPLYKAICEMTGINILSLSERQVPGVARRRRTCRQTQVDTSAPSRWSSTPTRAAPGSSSLAQRSMQVHPGELTTVMYEFQNVQNRRMAAQAIPSYAPGRRRRTSTSWNASASTSTRWSRARRSSGRWRS